MTKLILLHTVVVLYYTQHKKIGMIGQGVGEAVKMLKNNLL